MINNKDRYWYWCASAITRSPDLTDERYCYDRKEDTLFSFVIVDNKIIPMVSNEHVKPENSILREIESKARLIDKESILELPVIPLSERKIFVNKFIKKNLEVNVETFEEFFNGGCLFSDEVDKKIKSLSSRTYYDWNWEKGLFISLWIKLLLTPLGIHEDSRLLW